jgi:hypothetical protein
MRSAIGMHRCYSVATLAGRNESIVPVSICYRVIVAVREAEELFAEHSPVSIDSVVASTPA